MGTATYFLFLFGVFIVGMVVMTAYYLFSERREFMEISDQPFRCRLNKAGAIQSLFLILACVLFCFLCPDKEWIKNNQMYFVCALFAGFGLIGLVPLKTKPVMSVLRFFKSRELPQPCFCCPKIRSFSILISRNGSTKFVQELCGSLFCGC